jgi:hypothetical protein
MGRSTRQVSTRPSGCSGPGDICVSRHPFAVPLVGVHYFKYLDDPKESKALDSAGGANKGLYSADCEPWVALLRRAQTRQQQRLTD